MSSVACSENLMTPSPEFLDDNFLLENPFSQQLYHEVASRMPIVDYHNHLSPKDIAENRRFSNLTEIWLQGDHYKWRAMRTNGVNEKYCTGDASPKDKFVKWAETVPHTLRNPLYHWSHLELKRYFGLNILLNAKNASDVYDQCSEMLSDDQFRVQKLLQKMNVKVVCTTDDPVDSLEFHNAYSSQPGSFRMFPTFRPDKVYAINDPLGYSGYLEKLQGASGVSISAYDDLIEALSKRINYFHSHGCRASDHGLENLFHIGDAGRSVNVIYKDILKGSKITLEDQLIFKSSVLNDLCKRYHEKGWVQQFHLGALRNNNSRALRILGPDTGFDSIGDFSHARALSRFLDNLDITNQLGKTILYNLNPADNAIFATMVGNFNDGSIPGKIQYGSGWWFLDQKDGMENQMNVLSNMGLLSRFVGMVTDSRSFLSFPRHEYFRRILCNLLGKDIQKGEIPHDMLAISSMVRAICFENAKSYFNF